MKSRIELLIIFICGICGQIASQKLPVIEADSNLVIIKDDEGSYGQWKIVPKYKPDIFETSKKKGWLTFYTDKDSITYQIHPDSVHNFIILLNNKDSAYTQIRYSSKYSDLIKKFRSFSYEDYPEIPEFTYQDSSSLELEALRREFNLDSIAGKGSELSKIENLLYWIHDLNPKSIHSEHPIIKNALNLIDQCKGANLGSSCEGLAQVLNGCYLAIGIKSRIVACMSEKSNFKDNHTINMVFSEQLGKWIWVDPTYQAFIWDDNSKLLGLWEVREKLLDEERIWLSPNASMNNQSLRQRDYFLLKEMAKNIYKFICPVKSEFNLELSENGKIHDYIVLIPIDGDQQDSKLIEKNKGNSGDIFRIHQTNNPNQFWVKPK